MMQTLKCLNALDRNVMMATKRILGDIALKTNKLIKEIGRTPMNIISKPVLTLTLSLLLGGCFVMPPTVKDLVNEIQEVTGSHYIELYKATRERLQNLAGDDAFCGEISEHTTNAMKLKINQCAVTRHLQRKPFYFFRTKHKSQHSSAADGNKINFSVTVWIGRTKDGRYTAGYFVPAVYKEWNGGWQEVRCSKLDVETNWEVPKGKYLSCTSNIKVYRGYYADYNDSDAHSLLLSFE